MQMIQAGTASENMQNQSVALVSTEQQNHQSLIVSPETDNDRQIQPSTPFGSGIFQPFESYLAHPSVSMSPIRNGMSPIQSGMSPMQLGTNQVGPNSMAPNENDMNPNGPNQQEFEPNMMDHDELNQDAPEVPVKMAIDTNLLPKAPETSPIGSTATSISGGSVFQSEFKRVVARMKGKMKRVVDENAKLKEQNQRQEMEWKIRLEQAVIDVKRKQWCITCQNELPTLCHCSSKCQQLYWLVEVNCLNWNWNFAFYSKKNKNHCRENKKNEPEMNWNLPCHFTAAQSCLASGLEFPEISDVWMDFKKDTLKEVYFKISIKWKI